MQIKLNGGITEIAIPFRERLGIEYDIKMRLGIKK